jgi:WD40 repeat protein
MMMTIMMMTLTSTAPLPPTPTQARALSQPLHTGYISKLCASPCGQYVSSGGRDGVIHVWRLGDGQRVMSFDLGRAAVTAVTAMAWATGGDKLLAGKGGSCMPRPIV